MSLIVTYSYFVRLYIYRQTPDHPKLYLWSEQGSKRNEEPQPNKLEECKFIYYNICGHVLMFVVF